MIDASPGTGLNDIHDFVLGDDVSFIMNTKELFEEQDEMENMEADGKIMLFSPIEESYKFGSTTGSINLCSPLQDLMQTPIPSNQNLLPVAQLVPYTQMYSKCGSGLQELIQQNLQQKEAFNPFTMTGVQNLLPKIFNRHLLPSFQMHVKSLYLTIAQYIVYISGKNVFDLVWEYSTVLWEGLLCDFWPNSQCTQFVTSKWS
jgi:hypothetical protein